MGARIARTTTDHRKARSTGTFLMQCRIEQHGPNDFDAVVVALPDGDCPPGTAPQSETRRQPSREMAFMACAEMGFAMEARLVRNGARVRGWPPRGKAGES